MNLRQHETQETSDETRTRNASQNRAWYLSPDIEGVPAAQTPTAQTAPAPQTLFELAAAERIIARAGVLQEVREQMLTPAQIEAVAAEIGIRPEFVRLAIEQEKHGDVLAPRPITQTAEIVASPTAHQMAKRRIISTTGACVIVAATYLTSFYWVTGLGITEIVLTLCVFPLLLALALGIIGRSRRWAAFAGAALAATAVWTVLILTAFEDGGTGIDPRTLQLITTMFAASTGVALIGAEGRRQAVNYQVRKRRKSTVVSG